MVVVMMFTCDVVYSGGDTEDPALVDPLVSCTSLNSANNNWCLTVADAFDANTLESAVAALYDDNCGTITATYTGKTPGTNTNCSWSFTYHFTIDDGCGNDVTCDVVYSGGDTEDPARRSFGFMHKPELSQQQLVLNCR